MKAFTLAWHETLPSTNAHLRALFEANPALPCGTAAAARVQTAGRGRYSRTWTALPGRDLAFSFLWRGIADPANLPSLLMAAALGVTAALTQFRVAARVKWPNDVWAGRNKVCGILAELLPTAPGQEQAVIAGIGVNVNMDKQTAAQIDRPATSIFIETGQEHPVDAVLDATLQAMLPRIQQWEEGGFEGLRQEWERHALFLGLPITVEDSGKRKSGVLTGFDTHGGLRLRAPGAPEETLLLGDVLGWEQA